MKNIYLDHAATTYIKPEVLDTMLPFYKNVFGNPSSLYALGRESKKTLENSRIAVAGAINCRPEEIFFTSSGTEADNWAVKGAAYANIKKGKHIITSAIEHHAVLHTCEYLEKQGFEVTYIPVDTEGIISLEALKKAIRPDTTLISVMTANNEIGTIQPIKEIGILAHENEIIFHTDAVQAIGSIKIDVRELGLDMLSMSSHKFYGPKGVGALYIKKGTKITNFIHGGGQESGKRAGTENVPGIAGMAKAIEIATADIEQYAERIKKLRDTLIERVFKEIPYVRLNGHMTKRLPGNVNFSFEFIEGESLLLLLDMKGVSASSGSACSSGTLDPSHVLLAIGLPHEIAHGSLRLTFGEMNTIDDVNYVMEVLPPIVMKLREMSPLYEKIKHKNEA